MAQTKILGGTHVPGAPWVPTPMSTATKKCCNIRLIIIGPKTPIIKHVIMPHLWTSQNFCLSVEYYVGQEENLYSARSVASQF